MKALYLCNSPYYSGAEQETLRALIVESPSLFVLSNLPGLSQRAEEIRRIRPGHQLEIREIPRHRFGIIRELVFVLNAVKESRSKKTHLVVASNLKTAAAAAAARLLGGATWIWYVHDYYNRRGFVQRVAAKCLLGTCSGWIAVSRDVAEVTRQMVGCSEGGAIVYNYVRRSIHPPNPQLPRTRMEDAVLFVGSINPWKGLLCLVEGIGAVKALRGAAPRVDVVGHVIDTEYWASVQALAARLGLVLRYLGPRDDVPRLMSQYDVLIHPTPAPEPFGLVVAEAILAGCFVISTAQGGVREIMPPEMLECCFDPKKPSSFAEAMLAAEEARVRYGHRRNSAISNLAAMTSEEAYSQSLRHFFEKVVPEPAMP